MLLNSIPTTSHGHSLTLLRHSYPRPHHHHHRQSAQNQLHIPPFHPQFHPSLKSRPFLSQSTHRNQPQRTLKDDDDEIGNKPEHNNNFWGAVSLIIGTAVGPGMLGLPSLTVKSGPIPSTIAILLSWIYVISSIVLVAELSFAAMEEDGVQEVSFTGLATKALGFKFGAFVAVIYASLSFALVVACVSGIGSIVRQCCGGGMNLLVCNSVFPVFVGSLIWFLPFKAVDGANRFLCFIMLCSIVTLVVIGSSVARINVLTSFRNVTWAPSVILPAIPVTVLTLGFHVITPFVCRTAGRTVYEARKAILIGGSVPLVMVLLWNVIVLGLAGSSAASSVSDPISMLLSVNPSALSAVQGFAFSALATSLIGYAVSFPKQILDTIKLIFGILVPVNPPTEIPCGNGKVGVARFFIRSRDQSNQVTFLEANETSPKSENIKSGISTSEVIILPIVLAFAVFIASCYPSTFSRAIDFAGVYANSFLFGILPPVMAYIYRSRKKVRSVVLPGGSYALLLLFTVAVILAIWH